MPATPAVPPVLFARAWHSAWQGTLARAMHWPTHLTWHVPLQPASGGSARQLASHSPSQVFPQAVSQVGWQLASFPHAVSQRPGHAARQSCRQVVVQSKLGGSASQVTWQAAAQSAVHPASGAVKHPASRHVTHAFAAPAAVPPFPADAPPYAAGAPPLRAGLVLEPPLPLAPGTEASGPSGLDVWQPAAPTR